MATAPNNTRFRPDLIHPSVYLAPGAKVLGDVAVAARSSIWFNAVLRGDTAPIRIGCESNIQDGAILHADEGFPCVVGDRVSIGHGAIVHGALVADDVLIGMRSVVMNGAKIGAGSIIAVGAVVTEGAEIPPASVVMGLPAKVHRAATAGDLERIRRAAQNYVSAAAQYWREGDGEVE